MKADYYCMVPTTPLDMASNVSHIPLFNLSVTAHLPISSFIRTGICNDGEITSRHNIDIPKLNIFFLVASKIPYEFW